MTVRTLKFPRMAVAVTSLTALTSTLAITGMIDNAPAQAADTTYRMSVAPAAVTDSAGSTWAARTGFDRGDYSASYAAGTDIKNTTDDALYRSEMVRMTSWSRPVANGTYDVTLKMREAWWSAAGQRVFDVTAEGALALEDVDIFKAVGKQAAYDRTFRVTVTDGRLDLGFKASKDSGLVSAIQVTPVTTPTPTPTQTPAPTRTEAPSTGGTVVHRVSVSPTPVKDSTGATYAARSGFAGGEYFESFPAGTDIKGTSDDALYRPELVRTSGWSKALPAGTYDVTLKMRESWWNTAGARVFDVTAEGATRLTGVDVFKAVGKGAAYDRTFRVPVTDGTLNVGFVNRKDSAAVSAIVVTKVNGTTPNPSPTTSAPAPTPTPSTPAPSPSTTTPAPTPSNPATNVSRPSGLIFDSGVFPMHKAGVVSSFEAARGRKVDVINVFPARENWNSMQEGWIMDGQRIPAGFKGTLDVGVPLWPNDGNIGTAAAGGYNAQWQKFGAMIAAKYPTAYIRLGWEMNLPGWKHAAYPAQAEQWKQAYRHAVTSIRKGGSKLRIAWVVNEGPGQTGTHDARIFYPGDAYVDFIGMDAYDWWPGYTTDANIAKHRDSAYGWNFWLDFAKSRNKKFVLPEWGVAPANSASGGDNPKYINFVYSWMKQNQAWMGYESYFNEQDSYIRSDLFTNSPRASAEYRRWMPLLAQ